MDSELERLEAELQRKAAIVKRLLRERDELMAVLEGKIPSGCPFAAASWSGGGDARRPSPGISAEQAPSRLLPGRPAAPQRRRSTTTT